MTAENMKLKDKIIEEYKKGNIVVSTVEVKNPPATSSYFGPCM